MFETEVLNKELNSAALRRHAILFKETMRSLTVVVEGQLNRNVRGLLIRLLRSRIINSNLRVHITEYI